MIRPVATVLVVLAFTVPARAQESQPDGWLTAGIIAGAALQTADIGLTVYGVQHGVLRETNPLLRWAQDEPAAYVVTRTALTAGAAWWLRDLGKRRPKTARVSAWIIAGFYGAVVIHNARQFTRRQGTLAP